PDWIKAAGVKEPTEEQYYSALQKNLAKDRQQEKSLRILAWWRSNDHRRSDPQCLATATDAWRENLEALARLLDDRDDNEGLTKAEVFRELGQFDLAKDILSRVNPKHHVIIRQLRDLCNRGERRVRRLSFEEAQDVETLIDFVKGKARGSQ